MAEAILVNFTPVVVTVETLQVLAKQDNCDRLLALYMSYVEITTWQNNNRIKATTDFMATRLGWEDKTVRKYKKVLGDLGLIEDTRRVDEAGRVVGHFVLVKHVAMPQGGLPHGVAQPRTSTNNYKLSTNNYKESIYRKVPPSPLFGGSELKLTAPANPEPVPILPLEESRSTRKEKSSAKKEKATAAQARELFELYKREFGTPRTLLTDGRMRLLRLRIDHCGFDMVAEAIRRTAASSWHRGENESNWKANIDFIIRKDEQVERLANLEASKGDQEREELNKFRRENGFDPV